MDEILGIENLIQRAKHDHVAEERLRASYRGYLRFLARMQIGRKLEVKADASDLVRETMLQAHRAFAQFQGTTEQELLAWLRKVLKSRLVQPIRRHTTAGRDHRLEERLQTELDGSAARLSRAIPVNIETPSRQAIRRESGVLLTNALEKLSDDFREVITLHHVEGLKFAEVAERMHRSPAATQRMWIRALVKLREIL